MWPDVLTNFNWITPSAVMSGAIALVEADRSRLRSLAADLFCRFVTSSQHVITTLPVINSRCCWLPAAFLYRTALWMIFGNRLSLGGQEHMRKVFSSDWAEVPSGVHRVRSA